MQVLGTGGLLLGSLVAIGLVLSTGSPPQQRDNPQAIVSESVSILSEDSSTTIEPYVIELEPPGLERGPCIIQDNEALMERIRQENRERMTASELPPASPR
jgi:hypothetical protein